ncbi:MAG TPA: formylglycine-generating enzyme family protein [Candidatus Stackebrandtia excrementipullorum]|nr:formylglycine-generating enzyme family protein [Candidatus Stackebrandtia excrementipullorum]
MRTSESVEGVAYGLAVIDDEFVNVDAGEVTLTDRRTERSWSVDVAAFELAAVPVTRRLYAEADGDEADLPVVEVSWFDAVEFCNRLSARTGVEPAYIVDGNTVTWDRSSPGYRLPDEAEWEYACRAGTSGPRYGALDDIAWYRGNSGERVHAVATREPNPWGLYDMLGNVWEWCFDIYDADVYADYRVLRGGGWFDEHWSCRASVRRRTMPTWRIDDLGFRLARNIT